MNGFWQMGWMSKELIGLEMKLMHCIETCNFFLYDRYQFLMMELSDGIIASTCTYWRRHTATRLERNGDQHQCGSPSSVFVQPLDHVFSTKFPVHMIPIYISNVILDEFGITNYVQETVKAGLRFVDSTIPKPFSKDECTSIGVRVEVGWCCRLVHRGHVG